jgi:putative transposase
MEDVRKIVEKRNDSTGACDRLREIFIARKKESRFEKRVSEQSSPEGAEGQREQAIQISLPLAEVLSSLEQGLGELVRKVGRMFIESVLESEVEQIAGPRSCRRQTRPAYCWGIEQGSCLIDGQRVPIARPRVRACGGKELPLGTYQPFQQVTPAEETV